MSDKWNYVQPRQILDLAWDRYMLMSHRGAPEGAPSLVDAQDLIPADFSRLFDIAITAYREHTEGGQRPPETGT